MTTDKILFKFFHPPCTPVDQDRIQHWDHCYTAKNDQIVAILMKTGLNSALLPTLFTVANNIEQCCYTRFMLNNIVQYCWQVWTTWAAKHCSILLSSGLGVFCRVYNKMISHHSFTRVITWTNWSGVKKNPVVLAPDRPYFFCRPYYFFNVIDRATLFSPGGCGLLIQRAKMASVVTIIIEPNCLNSSIGNTHL
jgi:hypothetical protein